MGNALRAYPRDSFYLADKFPGYDLANIPKVEEIFEEQLKRCGVEYFDFYLFHNVCEMNIGAYLDPQYESMISCAGRRQTDAFGTSAFPSMAAMTSCSVFWMHTAKAWNSDRCS